MRVCDLPQSMCVCVQMYEWVVVVVVVVVVGCHQSMMRVTTAVRVYAEDILLWDLD